MQRLTNCLSVLALSVPIALITQIILYWPNIKLLPAIGITLGSTFGVYLFIAGISFLFGSGFRIWNK